MLCGRTLVLNVLPLDTVGVETGRDSWIGEALDPVAGGELDTNDVGELSITEELVVGDTAGMLTVEATEFDDDRACDEVVGWAEVSDTVVDVGDTGIEPALRDEVMGSGIEVDELGGGIPLFTVWDGMLDSDETVGGFDELGGTAEVLSGMRDVGTALEVVVG